MTNDEDRGSGPESSKRASVEAFPIVGIGASAGGLEALSELLIKMPSHPGIALVIIQHLDPAHASLTAEILSRKSVLPVEEVKSGVRPKPNHVYVIPPNRNMSISGGVLKLLPRVANAGLNLPINHFFKSLATDQNERAIGVILSGTASDGTHGLGAIKAHGGTTIVQDPSTAKYDGMPRSAILAGVADLVLSPEEIGRELARIAELHVVGLGAEEAQGDISHILQWVEASCHVDFSSYRQSTIKRRIMRRLVLQRIDSLPKYLSFLKSNPEEVKALFSDLLINVTEFFRDSRIFSGLKSQIFPKLLKTKNKVSPLRIWVVGCATGEEAYSVAISLLEYLTKVKSKAQFQIFATDISETALQKARVGEYSPNITTHISPDRLDTYFTKTESGYKVKKFIRELCVFSRHDVTRDPPFAKLDLICCRNLLIYFEPALQRRVLSVFHYALNSNGMLWLGRSESVGQSSKMFGIVDKSKKIYAKKPGRVHPQLAFPASRFVADVTEATKKPLNAHLDGRDLQREADRVALAEYAPPAVIVNEEMDIVSTRGDTTPYLHLPHGQASLNLYKMARPEIIGDLRMAIKAASKKMTIASKRGLTLAKGAKGSFSIKVIPIQKIGLSKDRFFQICFEANEPSPKMTSGRKVIKNQYVKDLERQLAEAKSYQESLISDFEMVQEELTSANEEMQSSNEEFQSTNEELETAKEELQSANEELTTINDELAARNLELDRTNNDLVNFFASVEIPVLMVGIKGEVRRFTPKAGKLMNLIQGDIGRPIGDIRSVFGDANLPQLIAEAIDNTVIKEVEVRDPAGPWYRLQVRPYKTVDNKIDGAVITLIDIDLLKRSLQKTSDELYYAMAVADSVQLPLVIIDSHFSIQSVNRAFSEKFWQMRDFIGQDLVDVFDPARGESLQSALKRTTETDQPFQQLKCHVSDSTSTERTLLFGARTIGKLDGRRLLVSVEDITEREALEKQRDSLLKSERDARQEAERADSAKDMFLSILSHELRTPLNAILSWAQLIRMSNFSSDKLKHGIRTIEVNAKIQTRLVDDLLDMARIKAGKLSVSPRLINPSDAVTSAIEAVRPLADRKNIKLELIESTPSLRAKADPVRLQQVVWNLITNAIKFSDAGQCIRISVAPAQSEGRQFVAITVADEGRGIEPKFVPQLFERFSQAELGSSTRAESGLGLGLAIASDLLKIHGGSIQVKSDGLGKGAAFTALIPLETGPVAVVDPSELPRLEALAPKPEQLPDLIGIRVLIVDDSFDSLDILEHTLRFFGAEVVACGSAQDALAALDKMQPDVLISDIAMPGEDGYSLIRKIRQRSTEAGGDIPAIALSAFVADEDIKRALTAGFQAHLSKPFDADSLGRQVVQLAIHREGLPGYR